MFCIFLPFCRVPPLSRPRWASPLAPQPPEKSKDHDFHAQYCILAYTDMGAVKLSEIGV